MFAGSRNVGTVVFNFDCSTIRKNRKRFWKWSFCIFYWSSHCPDVVRQLYFFSFRLSLGCAWTYCTFFVTLSMQTMFTWMNRSWYSFALLFICDFSTKLLSSFFILIWILKLLLVEWKYFDVTLDNVIFFLLKVFISLHVFKHSRNFSCNLYLSFLCL